MDINFRLAVKAFIVDNGKLLLMKRRSNDVHKPGAWDIPGGRLDIGEDPYEGLARECREEAGLNDIQIEAPLDVHHFTRDDGQKITMIIFLCRLGEDREVNLSEEHQEYKWVDPKTDEVPQWLLPTSQKYDKFFRN